LQFKDINLQDREKVNEALLRYCELDTLAMVIIIKAWDEISNLAPTLIDKN
jgi:hypothetical protein